MNSYREKRDDCPNCGKEEGAKYGNSEWKHNYMCCSDKCGLAIRKKLSNNVNSKEYDKALSRLEKCERRVSTIRHRGLPNPEPFWKP